MSRAVACLFAVTRPLVAAALAAPARERIRDARAASRRCLELSAELAGALRPRFEKDGEGRPAAADGWHWSVSDTRGRVAAVAARSAVGIDVEPLARPESPALARGLLPGEVAALGESGREARLRLWTAKEAVLKKTGLGLAALSGCRLVRREEGVLWLELAGALHRVLQEVRGEHVVSLSADPAEGWEVRWP